MRYADPGTAGSKVTFKSRYDNFIAGKFVARLEGALGTGRAWIGVAHVESPAW